MVGLFVFAFAQLSRFPALAFVYTLSANNPKPKGGATQ